MRWPDYTKLHPDAWVIVEIVATRERSLERIAIVEVCSDAESTYRRYRELRRAAPDRELCFLYTAWEGLELEERWQFSSSLADTIVTA